MPHVLLLVAYHAAVGLLVACLGVGALILTDAAHMRHLLLGSPAGAVGCLVLTLGLATLLGAAHMAARVFLDAEGSPADGFDAPAQGWDEEGEGR